MSRSQIQVQNESGRINISVSGVLDEDTDFSKISLPSNGEVHFDLSQVKSINSCGIRDWIKWLSATPEISVVFHQCPKVIVDQINMVQGFLPERGKVDSFFVPYFSEETEEEKLVLFRTGAEYQDNGQVMAPEIQDSSGNAMEMDIVESKYFKFLQKK